MQTVFQVAFIVMCWQGDCTRFESVPYAMNESPQHCEKMLRWMFTNSVGPHYDDIIDFDNSSPEDIIIDDAGCEPTQREPQDGDEWRIERQWDSPKNEKFLQDQNDLQWQQQQEHNIDD